MESSPPQDRLTPFFFGPAEKQLFGAYHAPAAGTSRDFGVLLCNPWGQEAVRAQRALLQLGLRLARQGFPTLRFDYFATGDSAGEDAQGSLGQWQADLRSAIQELKRRGRVETVFLAGLRLGASLAALVASGRDDVEGLVLWEPIVDGKAYAQELDAWHQEKLNYFLAEGEAASPPGAPPLERVGFGLAENTLAEIQSLDLLTLRRRPAARLLVIESVAFISAALGSDAYKSVGRFCDYLRSLGAHVDYQHIESFKMWTEDPDKGLAPQPILEAAVNWIVQEGA